MNSNSAGFGGSFDDNFEVSVDGERIISHGCCGSKYANKDMSSGVHFIMVRWSENTGRAYLSFKFERLVDNTWVPNESMANEFRLNYTKSSLT